MGKERWKIFPRFDGRWGLCRASHWLIGPPGVVVHFSTKEAAEAHLKWLIESRASIYNGAGDKIADEA